MKPSHETDKKNFVYKKLFLEPDKDSLSPATNRSDMIIERHIVTKQNLL